MKLEIGKFYRTRHGKKVGPLKRNESDEFPFADEGLIHTYRMDGAWHIYEVETDYDLVAEWTDEPAGPVRTVTSKEIVPGVYGEVAVHRDFRISMADMRIAEELTAAIATLTEIRDALEQNQ